MIMQASLENLLNNPFVNHFVDCIENLPNRIQLLLSELKSVDVQVRGRLTHFLFLPLYLVFRVIKRFTIAKASKKLNFKSQIRQSTEINKVFALFLSFKPFLFEKCLQFRFPD